MTEASNQSRVEKAAKNLPVSDHSKPADVLLIARDTTMRLYTDEVLRRSGLRVHSVTPWEARNLATDRAGNYQVVVFSHTLHPQDILEIGAYLRRSSPGSKLLLMLGPDPTLGNLSMFDYILEELAGPTALVKAVRTLSATPATASRTDGTSDGSLATLD